MWVQLKTRKHLEVQGRPRAYEPGDWVEVGKQAALRWIAEGSAWVPEGRAADLLSDECGIFVWGDEELGKERIGDYAGKVETATGDFPELKWAKTMVFNPLARLRKELVPIGFHLLDTWQVAIPLWDYDELAKDVGDEEDRERTVAVVRDLRVPLYSADLMFVKRCGDTEQLMKRFKDELARGGDRRLALLRALYAIKPLMLALPTTWIWKDMAAVKSNL